MHYTYSTLLLHACYVIISSLELFEIIYLLTLAFHLENFSCAQFFSVQIQKKILLDLLSSGIVLLTSCGQWNWHLSKMFATRKRTRLQAGKCIFRRTFCRNRVPTKELMFLFNSVSASWSAYPMYKMVSDGHKIVCSQNSNIQSGSKEYVGGEVFYTASTSLSMPILQIICVKKIVQDFLILQILVHVWTSFLGVG